MVADYLGSLKTNCYRLSSEKIRTFREGDLDRVSELYLSCFNGKNLFQIAHYSRLFRNTFYLYEEQAVVIAYLAVYVHLKFKGLKLVQIARVYSGCVDEKQRGRGVYSALYTECLSELRKNDVRAIYACVRKNNLAALRVHQKMGFRILEKNDNKNCSSEFYQLELQL
jgi:ribosomal protein S18 acetylase RimI-like enzyme